MEWMKDRKNRLTVSVLAAMAAAALVADCIRIPEFSPAAAWWGTLYPEFCYAEEKEDGSPKISFWLAEVLDW